MPSSPPPGLEELHDWYIGCATRFVGDRWTGDRGITLTAAEYLARTIRLRRPAAILEMGSGFSTFVLRRAAAEVGAEVFSVDHAAQWLGFIRGLVSTSPELDQSNFYTVEEIKALATENASEFGIVFVDHGPTWRARLRDLGWCRSVLAPDGQLILDDWYPPATRAHRNYTVPARRRLHRLGMKLRLATDSQREGDRKALCLARCVP